MSFNNNNNNFNQQVKLPPLSFLSNGQSNNQSQANNSPTPKLPSLPSLGPKNEFHLPSISSFTSGLSNLPPPPINEHIRLPSLNLGSTPSNSHSPSLPKLSALSMSHQGSPIDLHNPTLSQSQTPTQTQSQLKIPSLSVSGQGQTQAQAHQEQQHQLPAFQQQQQQQQQQPRRQSVHQPNDQQLDSQLRVQQTTTNQQPQQQPLQQAHHFDPHLHHHLHHHVHNHSNDFQDKLKEAQTQLKDGGHIHVVHQPHGDHHHHKIIVHNPELTATANATTTTITNPINNGNGNDTTLLQGESTIIDPNSSVLPNSNNINSITQTPTASTVVAVQKKTKPTSMKRMEDTISSKSVLESALRFSRKNLGSIIYEEYPTFETVSRFLNGLSSEDQLKLNNEYELYKLALQQLQQESISKASKRIELLPSLISNYINCTIDVHVPYHAIVNNDNVFNRRLWGTDVYTDDSDIVAMLYHCGILNSSDPTLPEDDDDHNNKQTKKSKEKELIDSDNGVYKFNKLTNPLTPANMDNIHDVIEDEDGDDLIVTLLILPTLGKYQGSYRNNYNSRTWSKTEHNGVSISIFKVKWTKLDSFVDDLSYIGSIKKRRLNERIEVSKAVALQEPRTSTSNKGNVGRWAFDKKYWKGSKVSPL